MQIDYLALGTVFVGISMLGKSFFIHKKGFVKVNGEMYRGKKAKRFARFAIIIGIGLISFPALRILLSHF